MHIHSYTLYENEFNLQVNEISFSYERMGTKTRFEKEAKGNSEMAYCNIILFCSILLLQCSYWASNVSNILARNTHQ